MVGPSGSGTQLSPRGSKPPAAAASPGRILTEFFLEAAVLTLLSGAAGLLFAWGVSSLVSQLPLPTLFAGLPITRLTALVATGTLVIVGVLSAIYPARRASRMTPVEAVSPEASRWLPINLNYRTRNYTVSGVYAAFERIRSMKIEAGRFLSEDDVLQRRRVVVIGATLKRELFSGLAAVGSTIKIAGVRFTVIGVLHKKTQITNYAAPDDVTAHVPFATFSTLVNTLDWNEFLGLVTNLGLGLKILLAIMGTLPMLGPIFQDTSDQGDIRLTVSFSALLVSSLVLTAVGLIAGLIPAIRAARLAPAQAMRSE